MASTPLERKKEEEIRLSRSIGDKRGEMIDLVKQVNEARKRALASIEQMRQAVEESANDYMEYINSLEQLQVKADKLDKS